MRICLTVSPEYIRNYKFIRKKLDKSIKTVG